MKIFPPFRLDPANQCLWRDGVRVAIAPKQFAVLRYLVEHPGRLVTQDELLSAVWPDTFVQPEVLRKYILELRKALGDRPKNPLFIETFPKRGYQFVAAVIEDLGQTGSSTRPSHPSSAAAGRPIESENPAGVIPIGRGSVLDEIETLYAKAVDGHRQIVFLTGEAGIGKSTVLDAFEQRLAQHPAAGPRAIVLRGQCVEGFGGKEAYYPVLEALGQLIRRTGAEQAMGILASQAPTWLIQFPAVLKPEQREQLQREILGATRERMVRELCEALDSLAAETPVVLIFEDLHWVDASTLDLLSAVARRRGPARLLVLATYRPVEAILRQSPLRSLKQDLVIHKLCREISLERLTESNIAEYLAAEFPGAALPEGLAGAVHRQSDGNPLFMTAIIGELVEKSVLSVQNGSWVLSRPIDEIELGVPETLHQMLELQVDQLSETERRVLNCASVAGKRFSAWAVAAMLEVSVGSAEGICETFAERQQFLRPGRGANVLGGSVSAHYEFRHSLYSEALYRRLPAAQRSALHLALASKAEALLAPEDAREFASELAQHFENGRDSDRAARYLIVGAGNAMLKYAHRDSIAMLEHALRLIERSGSDASRKLEIEVLERTSDALYALGDMERSVRVDERAAALAGERGMRAAQIDALTRAARALSFLDPDDCVTVCERAVEVSGAHGDPLLHARTEMLAACWRIVNNGWTQHDAELCEAARRKIRELQGPALPAYHEILYAHVQSLQGQYADSCAIADAGLARATEIHSLVMYLSSLSSKALALIHLGWWGELRRVLEHGIDLSRKNGNDPWAGIFEAMLAWLHMQSCDFDGARHRAEILLKKHTEEPMGQSQSIALLTAGYSDLATGHAGRAMEMFTRVRNRPTKPKVFLQWYWRMIAEFGLVGSLLELGQLEDAETTAKIFLDEVLATADPALRSPAWDALARVSAARGDLPRALEYSQHAVEEIKGFDLPSVAWRIHNTAALLDKRAGNRDGAEHHRDRAEAALRLVADSFAPADPLRASLAEAATSLRARLASVIS